MRQFDSSARLTGVVLCASVLLNLSPSWAQTPVAVTEYYNVDLDAYFITGRINEQSLLDTANGFRRTGMNFASVSALTAPANLTSICRYYTSAAWSFVSSHFYGVQNTDCAQNRRLFRRRL